jgi:Na+/proline symporter
MSSTASGLNALASTTAIDIYKQPEGGNQKSTISTRQSFYLVLGVVAILLQV